MEIMTLKIFMAFLIDVYYYLQISESFSKFSQPNS